MSRTGFKVIEIPNGVEVNLENNTFTVKGPNGTLNSPCFNHIDIKQEGNILSVSRNSESKEIKAKHGLVRALLANCIIGVTTGFQKELEIVGVGFRAQVKGSTLQMNLGFSHDVDFPIPEGIKVEVKENIKLSVSGINKGLVGQVSAKIRGLKPPEPYKGKGVRYANEYIKKKAGKTGKK